MGEDTVCLSNMLRPHKLHRCSSNAPTRCPFAAPHTWKLSADKVSKQRPTRSKCLLSRELASVPSGELTHTTHQTERCALGSASAPSLCLPEPQSEAHSSAAAERPRRGPCLAPAPRRPPRLPQWGPHLLSLAPCHPPPRASRRNTPTSRS